MIALFFAAALTAYPAPAQAALAIDDAAGLRAFLDAAGAYARSVSADEIGRMLREQVGLDPLALQGPRTIVFAERATGMIAKLDAATAKRALAIWKRPNRFGIVAKGRLYTASGREAQALLKALQHPKPLGKKLAPHAKGPVSLWLALAPPQSAAFALDASAQGLELRGLVTAARPILQGPAPRSCDGAPMGCLRTSLGPAGREFLLRALAAAGKSTSVGEATRAAGRLDGFDALKLSDRRSLSRILHYAIAFDSPAAPADDTCHTPAGVAVISSPPCAPLPPLDAAAGPALEATLDLAQIDKALSRLTPLDALNGEAAAGAYAAHLIYGRLLSHAGPLTLTGDPAQNDAAAAELSLQLPLR